MPCVNFFVALFETCLLGSGALVLTVCLTLFLYIMYQKHVAYKKGLIGKPLELAFSHKCMIAQLSVTIMYFISSITLFWQKNDDDFKDEKNFDKMTILYRANYGVISLCAVSATCLVTFLTLAQLEIVFNDSAYQPKQREVVYYRIVLGLLALGFLAWGALFQNHKLTSSGVGSILMAVSMFLMACLFFSVYLSITWGFIRRLLLLVEKMQTGRRVRNGSRRIDMDTNTRDMTAPSIADSLPVPTTLTLPPEQTTLSATDNGTGMHAESGTGAGMYSLSDIGIGTDVRAESGSIGTVLRAKSRVSTGIRGESRVSTGMRGVTESFGTGTGTRGESRAVTRTTVSHVAVDSDTFVGAYPKRNTAPSIPTLAELRSVSISNFDETSQPLLIVATKHAVLTSMGSVALITAAVGWVLMSSLTDRCHSTKQMIAWHLVVGSGLLGMSLCGYLSFGANKALYDVLCPTCDYWCSKCAAFYVRSKLDMNE